jgi:hypothetical protein
LFVPPRQLRVAGRFDLFGRSADDAQSPCRYEGIRGVYGAKPDKATKRYAEHSSLLRKINILLSLRFDISLSDAYGTYI